MRSLRGKPVLITLFTTGSIRCQAEMAIFIQLHEREGPRGLQVLGVALAPLGLRGLPLVKTYVEVTKIPFAVLLAEPGNLELVGALGKTPQVPRTVLLDRGGSVVLDHRLRTRFPQLRAKINQLLAK